MKARVILLAAIFLYSCGTETTPIYQLNVTAEPAVAGMVTPVEGEFESGSEIQLTATPNRHWVFSGWQGDIAGSDNPATVIMSADKNIVATFEKQDYPLTVLIEGEGTVQQEVIAAKTDYPHGTTLRLTPAPEEGWLFAGWRGDRNGSENPLDLTIHRETTVTAIFEIKRFDVEIQTTGRGSVEQQIVPGKTTYDQGTIVQFTAIPEDGWEFAGWGEDLSGDTNPMEAEITGDMLITAHFELKEYAVSYDVKGEGHIAVRPRKEAYTYGDRVHIEAVPNIQWKFSEWGGGVSGTENPTNITVTESMEVLAIFEKRPAELELFKCGITCTSPFSPPEKVPFSYYYSLVSFHTTPNPVVTVQRFTLRAINSSYTITGLSATDSRRVVSASISGLKNGQVIKPGETVQFALVSGFTRGRQADISYRFSIRETDQTFRYNIALTTN